MERAQSTIKELQISKYGMAIGTRTGMDGPGFEIRLAQDIFLSFIPNLTRPGTHTATSKMGNSTTYQR